MKTNWIRDFRIGRDCYALVMLDVDGEIRFGSIPYSYLDETGTVLVKEITAFQMLTHRTEDGAVDLRQKSVLVDDYRNAHPEATEMDVIMYMASLYL